MKSFNLKNDFNKEKFEKVFHTKGFMEFIPKSRNFSL